MLKFVYSFVIPATLTTLSAIIGYVVWLVQQQRTEAKEAAKEQKKSAEESDARMKALETGVMLMMRQQLVDYHTRFCVDGESMSAEIYDDITETYNAYHALGGNGTGTKMYEEIKEIHLS